MLVNWIAHIHEKDGKVREITVTTEGGRKKEALDKVCRAAGITGPNDGSIRGLVIQEDRSGGWKVALGAELREQLKAAAARREEVAAKSAGGTVVPITRRYNKGGFKRYRIKGYLTRASANTITRMTTSRTAEEALNSVLAWYGLSAERSGDYLVYEMGETEDQDILRLRRGMPDNFERVEFEEHHDKKYTPSPLAPPKEPAIGMLPVQKPEVESRSVTCCSNMDWCQHYGICDATGCAIKAGPYEPESKPATITREEKMIKLPVIKIISGLPSP